MDSTTDLCQVAAGVPPDGHSNFDNPPSLAPAIMGVMGVTVAWGILFTAARFYINFRKLGLADYFNLIALLISISTLGIESTLSKTARHIWDVPACYFDDDYARGIYIPATLLQIGAFFAKASIFLLFRQLFTIQKPMRIAIWAGLVFNFLIYWIGVAVASYYETPRRGERWTAILDGRTLIPLAWWQAQSALSIVLDLYIFILPLPALFKLQLPLRQRISVIAVFSLALLGIGASIASLVERIEIKSSTDQTWISTILSLCSSVELNVAIIVSSAPAFASFSRYHLSELSVIKYFRASFSTSSRSKLADSEAELGGSNERYKHHSSQNSGIFSIPERRTSVPSHQYSQTVDKWQTESERPWTVHSGATAHRDSVHGLVLSEFPENSIMRTVGFEQAVRTTSTDGLVEEKRH